MNRIYQYSELQIWRFVFIKNQRYIGLFQMNEPSSAIHSNYGSYLQVRMIQIRANHVFRYKTDFELEGRLI